MASKMLTFIAGVGYRPGARDALRASRAGDALRLDREPDNEHDRNAVAVWLGDVQVGYVPAPDAPAVTLAVALDLGVTARLNVGGGSSAMTIEWE